MKNKNRTAPAQLINTATNFDSENLSPIDDGNIEASIRVKKLDVVLRSVTIAVSLGSSAN